MAFIRIQPSLLDAVDGENLGPDEAVDDGAAATAAPSVLARPIRAGDHRLSYGMLGDEGQNEQLTTAKATTSELTMIGTTGRARMAAPVANRSGDAADRRRASGAILPAEAEEAARDEVDHR